MKRRNLFLSSILLLNIFSGCSSSSTNVLKTPELLSQKIDDDYRTTYEIFVYSYADSDGDGIGDLNGITQSLDYLNDQDDSTNTDLGINQIWLTPIFSSPTYHKYDTTDYYSIDESFGTMEDFENLIRECHGRGIRVLLDLAMNHTSNKHPWFENAQTYLEEHTSEEITEEDGSLTEEAISQCPYLSYYNFSLSGGTGYEPLSDTDWYYEARFWSGMPDLNLDSEVVRNEIKNITAYWLNEGVDGFRLDAVSSYYSNNVEKNTEFLGWFKETVEDTKEDVYLVAECWTTQSTYSQYYASGIDSLFDFEFAGQDGIIANVVKGNASALGYAKALAAEEELYASYNSDFVNAPFYTNHDMARSAGYYAYDDGSRTKLSGGLNLLMTGNAFVYYGEEIGMKGSGKDENKRAPMLWSSEDTSSLCDGPEDMDVFEQKFEGVKEQQEDPDSIFHYYQTAIAIRNAYPVIARGNTIVMEDLSGDSVVVFTRTMDDASYDSVMILINTSEETQTVDLSNTDYSDINVAGTLTVSDENITKDGSIITLPGFSILILE